MFVVKQRPIEKPKVINTDITSLSNTGANNKSVSYLQYSDIPESDRAEIVAKFIKPIETKLNTTFVKLHKFGTKEADEIIKKRMSVINGNLKDLSSNLDKLKLAQAQANISNSGIKGFEIPLKMERGLQLDITPDSENYDFFFNIIRKYVFNYKGSEWPPDINKYNYFKYNNNTEKELCCFYWPLYGYIKTLFHNDFRGQIELTDLFSLSKMRKYCKDFFVKKPRPSIITTSKKKKGKSGGSNKNKVQNKGKNKGQNKGQNRFSSKTSTSFGTSSNNSKIVSSYAQGCLPEKLSKVEYSLRKTPVKQDINGKNTDTNEYLALKLIVSRHIRQLKPGDLLVKNSVKEFIESSGTAGQTLDDFPEEKDWSKKETRDKFRRECGGFKIGKGEPVIKDPLLGATFTLGDLDAWFPIQPGKNIVENKDGKKQKIIPIHYVDSCNIITNALDKFRSEYSLPSPMWRLQQDELNGIRNRFLKILTFLIISLKEMYERVKRKNSKSFVKNEAENKIKTFYSSLLKDIENEKNSAKKQEMIQKKIEFEAKFGDHLKEN